MWSRSKDKSRFVDFIFLLTIILVFVFVLGACQQAGQTEDVASDVTEETVEPTEVVELTEEGMLTDETEPTDEPFPPLDCPILEPVEFVADGLGRGAFFLKDRILFTGIAEDIGNVVDAINLDPGNNTFQLVPEWTIADLLPLSETGGRYTIQQYIIRQVGSSTPPTVHQVMILAAGIARKPENKWQAYPDPNYVIGVPSDTSGKSGGSPGIEGGPGGGSAGIEGAGGDAAGGAPDYFIQQWAFQDISAGINLFSGGNNTIAEQGAGVRVAIFDSLPVDLDSGEETHDPGRDTGGFPFRFCATKAVGTVGPNPGIGSVNEHGYFVASLVQAVAPMSDIHVAQVLVPVDEAVVGTQGYLLHTMDRYLKALPHPPEGEEDKKVVINLSLGFELSTNQDVIDHLPTEAQEACNAVVDLYAEANPEPISGLSFSCESEDEVPNFALWTYTRHVSEELGHLVVASAGNEWNGVDPRPSSLLPAGLPGVLGVGASNFEGQPSCFSNNGDFKTPEVDVKSPGGDGVRVVVRGENICEVNLTTQCSPAAQGCEAAVIGRVYVAAGNYSSGFAYWVGTSFSAPMASGLAALVWDARPDLTPGQVKDLIISCTSEAGIIDVQNTIEAIETAGSDQTPICDYD